MRRTVFPLPERPYRHGHPGRPVEIAVPEDRVERILYGADLFDHGAWWESHVAWEAAWLTVPRRSARGVALKGLIQAAAMQMKTSPTHRRAHERLRMRSVHHLEEALASGLADLEGLVLEPLVAAVRLHRPGDPPLQLGPVQRGRGP